MSTKRSRLVTQCGVLAVIFGLAVGMQAQSDGNNAISKDTSGTIAASNAYIDAAPFFALSQNNSDLCLTVNYILTSSTVNYPTNYPNGAVIDARGILPNQPSSGTPKLTCGSNPFANVPATCGPNQNASCPSTVLLPGATISVSVPWVLPTNTRIIGEGSGPQQNYTALGVFSTFNHPAIIQMGPTTGTATGVVIEHMQLNGGGQGNFDGIDNVSAGDGSYVNDVFINNIGANSTSVSGTSTVCTPGGNMVTSLCIGPGATYSGPYTNLNVSPSVYTACQTSGQNTQGMCTPTACVKIQAQTRGLHGITCVSTSTTSIWPLAAIYLDSYNTSIENVHVEGFQDAIVVGDYRDGQASLTNGSSISGNAIVNVVGSSGNGPVRNTVHICKPSVTSGACLANTTVTGVDNLGIMQALSHGGGSVTNAEAIQDDNSTRGSTSANGAPVYAGLYAVGSTSAKGGYSQFTTMPGNTVATPTWGVGGPISSGNTACTNSGAIFSNPNGQTNSHNTIYVCSGLQWVSIGN